MIAALWNRWNSQPTWRAFVGLTLIESVTVLALICLLEAIF